MESQFLPFDREQSEFFLSTDPSRFETFFVMSSTSSGVLLIREEGFGISFRSSSSEVLTCPVGWSDLEFESTFPTVGIGFLVESSCCSACVWTETWLTRTEVFSLIGSKISLIDDAKRRLDSESYAVNNSTRSGLSPSRTSKQPSRKSHSSLDWQIIC